MRCLYCGKELALLKRWTGGGEFCSDAHRQQYQDEYNQLALNRLLQAKPPAGADMAAEAKAGPANSIHEASKPTRGRTTPTTTQTEKPAAATTKPVAAPQPAPQIEAPKRKPVQVAEPEPEPERVVEFEPEPEPEIEYVAEIEPELEAEPAPAEMSGFLLELPIPIYAEVMAMSHTDSEFERSATPEIPQREVEAWETQLVAAGRLDSPPFTHFADYVTRPHDRKLDVREFVRTAPVVEVDLARTGETILPEMIEEPMDILILPHPPQGSPPLWDEPWREFSFEKELGVLARVAFRTTGIEDNEDASDPIESLNDTGVSIAPPPPPAKREASLVAAAPASEPEPVKSAPVTTAPVPVAKTAETPAPVHTSRQAPAPPAAPVAAPIVAPAPVRSTFLRPPLAPPPPVSKPDEVEVAAKVAPKVTPAAAPKVSEAGEIETSAAPAAPVTKPLPLTLHGLAAGRGKPVQVFAAVSGGVDLQIPRSNSLPLRPVMTLGPAVIEKAAPPQTDEKKAEEKRPDRTVIIKADPRKTQPGRPDPRFANGKGRKDGRPAEPEKKEVDKKEPEKKEIEKPIAASAPAKPTGKEIEKPADKIAAKTAPKVEEKQSEEKREERRREERRPEEKPVRSRIDSLPAPVAAPYTTPDLGLPSLNLEASGGFWTRLPVAGKAGVAVLLVAVIAGIFFMMKGGGATAAAGPHIVEAPAITAAEGGWITDWGAEPGVRKVRELSVLKPSLNMTDYRIEFEAQIESKALGWIYRAKDAKNYYVSKLEIVKPGLEPGVALVRYAVINGEEQPHSQIPLTMPLRIDTLYKVRFDAIADHFTTWVQDQKIDDWTDARLKTGGVGLYSDRGERINLKGSMRVAPLVLKK
jgi:hypothetical protein